MNTQKDEQKHVWLCGPSKRMTKNVGGNNAYSSSQPSRVYSKVKNSLPSSKNDLEKLPPVVHPKVEGVVNQICQESTKADMPTESNVKAAFLEETEETEADMPPESKVKAAFLEAAAKIEYPSLVASLEEVVEKFSSAPSIMLLNFCHSLGNLLSGVSLRWDDIFKEPDWSKLLDVINVSDIPAPVYTASVEWLDEHISDGVALGLVLYAFSDIVNSVFFCRWKKVQAPPTRKPYVAIYVALAMVLRTRPRVLACSLPFLREEQLSFKGKGVTPITVWMIAQASSDNLHVGLYSWARNLIPLLQLVGRDTQSRDLILELFEKILEKPDAQTKLEEEPEYEGKRLIPASSFALLLQLTFPATSAREEEATKRFQKIYPLLKRVALANVSKQDIQEIFGVSLRLLAVEGNHVLAEEATSIAIWSLDENVDCWKHWDSLCKEDLEASVALLKKLVDRRKDHSSKLPSSAQTQQIFGVSLRLLPGEEGNHFLAKEATSIAIWSLRENVDCWKHWDSICKENLEASVALLKTLVEKWMDNSFNLSSSSLTHTLARPPESKGMKFITQEIFEVSLRLSAGEGNPVLAKEAAAIAIWSLIVNVDCWMRWDDLYKENLEASVALLKILVEDLKDHSLKKLSSSRSETLTLKLTMSSFRLKNKKAITEGGASGSLYKEADKSCEVILERLSRGRGSSCLEAIVVLVTAVTVLHLFYLRVFCFDK